MPVGIIEQWYETYALAIAALSMRIWKPGMPQKFERVFDFVTLIKMGHWLTL